MGVDLATYRSRIGSFIYTNGSGIATFCININFSKAATWTGIFAAITCVLGIVVSHRYSQAVESKELFHFGVVDASIVSCFLLCKKPYLSQHQIIRTLKCIGVVAFIGMLLLLAGIEPNPGPNPKKDEEDHNPDKKLVETEPLYDICTCEMTPGHERQIGISQLENYHGKNDVKTVSDFQASLDNDSAEEEIIQSEDYYDAVENSSDLQASPVSQYFEKEIIQSEDYYDAVEISSDLQASPVSQCFEEGQSEDSYNQDAVKTSSDPQASPLCHCVGEGQSEDSYNQDAVKTSSDPQASPVSHCVGEGQSEDSYNQDAVKTSSDPQASPLCHCVGEGQSEDSYNQDAVKTSSDPQASPVSHCVGEGQSEDSYNQDAVKTSSDPQASPLCHCVGEVLPFDLIATEEDLISEMRMWCAKFGQSEDSYNQDAVETSSDPQASPASHFVGEGQSEDSYNQDAVETSSDPQASPASHFVGEGQSEDSHNQDTVKTSSDPQASPLCHCVGEGQSEDSHNQDAVKTSSDPQASPLCHCVGEGQSEDSHNQDAVKTSSDPQASPLYHCVGEELGQPEDCHSQDAVKNSSDSQASPVSHCVGEELNQSKTCHNQDAVENSSDYDASLVSHCVGKEKSQSEECHSQDTVETSSDQASPISYCAGEDNDDMSTDQREILESLDLTKYLQTKMTFYDIMSLQMNDSDEITMSDLPKKLIQGLITLNFEARDDLQNKIISRERKPQNSPFFDDEQEDDRTTRNNLDIFIAIFNCCDGFLKQIIVNKMIMCKLAVPIIYPLMSSGKLCFSIWPLRSSTLSLKGKKTMEVSATNHRMGIISLIRYDRPCLSKSHLINGILLNYSHPTFYHNDCHMGDIKRNISNGVVEASWYIPSGDNSDFSDDVLMFLNLRGDASMYKQQTQFIKRISSVLVVIVDFQNVTDYISEIKALNLCTSSFILLLTCNFSTVENTSDQTSVITKCKSEIPGVNIIRMFEKGKQKNAAMLKGDLIRGISTLLGKNEKSLDDCAYIANELGIVSDEDIWKCRTSNNLANYVLADLNTNSLFIKKDVLPLQGECWKRFTELYKEAKKIGKEFLDDNEKTEEKMKEVHKERTRICKSFSPFLGSFIKAIVDHKDDREAILYFLQWMKFKLNCRSRDILPRSADTFFACLNEFANHSEQSEKAALEIKQTTQNVDDAFLGLEHIFREIGQLYEAFIDKCLPEDIQKSFFVNVMPDIVSNILRHGFAFEIMDGDTGNIPTRWTKAVFKSLQSQISDKKILVVSILGVQSSGKSTFLNTMFGLQLPVSAGRCTRGIYMHLLPVEKTDALSNFDFVLVLDTEGIRASESSLTTNNRDNELATLALGMANITIVNIKGENTAEVSNVLQIAVHAFLRLKLTNEKLELNQSCIFVHQNVPDVNAEEKTRQARQELVQTLDVMTLSAAKHENIADITTFQQVIDFDYKEDVWYIPDLWQGTPPMAHANLGYSKKVMEVKAAIFKSLSKKEPSLLYISQFSSRMLDIWDGILADDFVYSFRNSLEVKVNNAMEMQCQRLSWEFEKCISLCSSSTKYDLDGNVSPEDTNKHVLKYFEKEAQEKFKSVKQELVNYFDENEYKMILNQWKESKLYFFQYSCNKMIENHVKDLRRKHEELQVEVETRSLCFHYMEEITHKAEDLAKAFTQRGLKANEAEITSRFNEMWGEWSNTLPQVISSEEDLEEEVTRILFEKCHGLHPYLQEEIKKLAISKWPGKENLTEDIAFIYNGGIQISVKKIIDKVFSDKMHEDRARNFTERLFKEVDIKIQNLGNTDIKFERIHLSSLLTTVNEKFNIHNGEGSKEQFTFLPPYQAKVLVHICRYVVYVFHKINKRYNEKHSPKSLKETFRQQTWTLFVNLISEKSPEGIAANMFCDLMHLTIKEIINERLQLEIAECILEHFKYSKKHIIIEILMDLADKDNFDKYMVYIEDPNLYAMEWLISHNEFTFAKPVIREKMQNIIKTFISNITDSLREAVFKHRKTDAQCSQQPHNKNIINIIERFETGIREKDFYIPLHHLGKLREYEIESEREFFDIAEKILSEIEEKLYEEFEGMDINISHLNGKNFEKLLKRLWGCDEKCPFCHEPCQRLKHDRVTKHSCVQHKPLVINGTVEENSRGMLGSCRFYVQTSKKFSCLASGLQCRKSSNCEKKDDTLHDYKKYYNVLPRWDIVPSADSSSSQYWSWFVVHFKNELQKYHGLKINNIPHSWSVLNKDDAKRSLIKHEMD